MHYESFLLILALGIRKRIKKWKHYTIHTNKIDDKAAMFLNNAICQCVKSLLSPVGLNVSAQEATDQGTELEMGPTEATVPPNFFKKQTILVSYYIVWSQYLFFVNFIRYCILIFLWFLTTILLRKIESLRTISFVHFSHYQWLTGRDCILLRLYFSCFIVSLCAIQIPF